MTTNGPRMLCIGVDAADKDLILQWAAAGLLPTFRRLLDTASWGFTVTPPGLFVGAVWPSFFTAVSPAGHGRYCYWQIRPGTYELHRFQSTDVTRAPFWEALSRAGRRVAIVDVPKTRCAEQLNGVQVVDWATHDPDPAGFCTWPRSLARDIEARFGRDSMGTCDARGAGTHELTVLRDSLRSRIERKTALVQYLANREHWDLFMAVFTESHCAGHQFWHLHDPAHPGHDATVVQALGDPLRDVYIAIDTALGKVLDSGAADTTVVVYCSHGMGPHYEGNFLLDEILRRLEHVPAPVARSSLMDAVRWGWQRTPRGVRALLRPVRDRVAKTLDGVPIQLDPTRNCFAVPNNEIDGAIRINLVGREPRGRIRPGVECDAFCDTLRRDLLEVVNVDTGRPAIRNVYPSRDLYQGAHLDRLPDLLVEWDRSVPISSVSSPKIGVITRQPPAGRTGDHKPDGLLIVAGPSIQPGRRERPVAVTDVAPTIASLLGVTLADVDGRPIAALVDPGSRARAAVPDVPRRSDIGSTVT